MNINSLFILIFLILISSCKKKQDLPLVRTIDNNTPAELTEKDQTKLNFVEFTLDVKTENVIKDWKSYFELQDVISNIKKGDLSIFKNEDDRVKILLENLRSNMPMQVKSSATSARILALETKLYKLKSLSNIPTSSEKELSNVLQEFLISFSNLNFQMNKKIEKDGMVIVKPVP